jgi:cellobiose phosphorylase
MNLEPGTFENGSVYQHAVAFKIFADIATGDHEDAFRTFINLLPTNPENFDARRTSEPYCTGNYYCGPSHRRFGQNFFTWFTGNPAWLLRAGFDEILGVKAGFGGLLIQPRAPEAWEGYSVKRVYRGTLYDISFIKSRDGSGKKITIDGVKLDGNFIVHKEAPYCKVEVSY